MKILVINGPNINFLGIREKGIYGTENYESLVRGLEEKGRAEGHEVEVFQSNFEGAVIDRIQAAYSDGTEGIIINPGAFTHYSYAVRDALASVELPKIEVHISNIHAREEYRHHSMIAAAAAGSIIGFGLDSYRLAIEALIEKQR